MPMRITSEIDALAHPAKAKVYARFFKTGPGEYGEGDRFLGLTVPAQRKIAQKYVDLPLAGVKTLLYNRYHEYRLTALFILVYKYAQARENEKKKIIDFYLCHRRQGNNWDLIDCIADKLLGNYLLDKNTHILYSLARSTSFWDRRIAIISTFAFIKKNRYNDTLHISEMLLGDRHDLIHKAVGWMLREVGKRNERILTRFLDRHYRKMPRTMLRYAVERLLVRHKIHYLKK